jgi:hypothetical protein
MEASRDQVSKLWCGKRAWKPFLRRMWHRSQVAYPNSAGSTTSTRNPISFSPTAVSLDLHSTGDRNPFRDSANRSGLENGADWWRSSSRENGQAKVADDYSRDYRRVPAVLLHLLRLGRNRRRGHHRTVEHRNLGASYARSRLTSSQVRSFERPPRVIPSLPRNLALSKANFRWSQIPRLRSE